MSIWSDYKVGALSDEEFERECTRMNNRDRIEREEEEDKLLWNDEDERGD